MNIDESFRLEQVGMGYMQYHAAIAWMRTLFQAAGVSRTEQGSTAWVGNTVIWEIQDTRTTTCHITFDHNSYGHLLMSVDGQKTWYGMDMTYYPPTLETWQDIHHRLENLREHPQRFSLTRRIDIKAVLAEPVQRKHLMVDVIIATQAREGITTTKEQAEAAYEKVLAEYQAKGGK